MAIGIVLLCMALIYLYCQTSNRHPLTQADLDRIMEPIRAEKRKQRALRELERLQQPFPPLDPNERLV